MKRVLIACLLISLVVAGGCSRRGAEHAPTGVGVYKLGKPYQIGGRWYHPHYDPEYSAVGIASWYGSAFHGRPTANGERFDKDRISAAHTTLPLPSRVRVTNLENGREIVLRVNDRGPFVDDRLIDLSEAAARELGFHEKGLARVRVDFLGLDSARGTPPEPSKPTRVASHQAPDSSPPEPVRAAPAPSTPELVQAALAGSTACLAGEPTIQIAAFSDAGRAHSLAGYLKGRGFAGAAVSAETGEPTLNRVQVRAPAGGARPEVILGQLRAMGYSNAFIIEDGRCGAVMRG
ncbi:MAG: septal ring lytic transglycosylase RlpA family protein [Geminicoccaceae bacterium]